MFELITIALFQFFAATTQPTDAQVGGSGWGSDVQQVGGSGWGSDAKQVGGSGWGSDAQQVGGSGWGSDIAPK